MIQAEGFSENRVRSKPRLCQKGFEHFRQKCNVNAWAALIFLSVSKKKIKFKQKN